MREGCDGDGEVAVVGIAVNVLVVANVVIGVGVHVGGDGVVGVLLMFLCSGVGVDGSERARTD